METLKIIPNLYIPVAELQLTTARSGGAGGQHVNKVNTKVILHFDVPHSPSLNEEQKQMVLTRLAHRINQAGELWLESQEHRSQLANKEAALVRFIRLMQQALKRQRPRRPTKIPASVNRKRLENKKKRSQTKSQRQIHPEF